MNVATVNRPAIPIIIQQHRDDIVTLYRMRGVLVGAGHVQLHRLRRLDERLRGHLDGLAIAGGLGWSLCEAALAEVDDSVVFMIAVRAMEEGDTRRLRNVIAISEASPLFQDGLHRALAWVSAPLLQGIVRDMLTSSNAFLRLLGLSACEAHQADVGASLTAGLVDADSRLRAGALQCAGASGRRELLGACVGALQDADNECRFRAAQAAVLLGDRGKALDALTEMALAPGSHRRKALSLLLPAVSVPTAMSTLRQIFADPVMERELVRGIGAAGDPKSVSWLIGLMDDRRLARLAAEALSMMTGVDIAAHDLDRRPPSPALGALDGEGAEDDEMAMDEDDGLPWPDREKVDLWWSENSRKFQAGIRHFMGEPPSRQHCLQVLENGCQRQRIAAARYICLLNPGSTFFPTDAPAWRQQRWLNAMDA